MIPGFGKRVILVGSDEQCDIELTGAGVAPAHARVVNTRDEELWFIDRGLAASFAGGRRIPPRGSVRFDFLTEFACGNSRVPMDHPALSLMIMTRGALRRVSPERIVIGRDPGSSNLVIRHPSLSAMHATVFLDRMVVVDEGSTTGTRVGLLKARPKAPTPLNPEGSLSLGLVSIKVSTLRELATAMAKPPFSEPPAAERLSQGSH